MKKVYLLLLMNLFYMSSMGQVNIKIGVDGMKDNSVIMLDAMCNCYGKDSVYYMLDSLSYFGVFFCRVDSKGLIVNIDKYRSNTSSFSEEELVKIKKYLQDHKIQFSIIYENDLGEDEASFKKRIRKDLKRYFRNHKTIGITVGFPGYLSPPWERYRISIDHCISGKKEAPVKDKAY